MVVSQDFTRELLQAGHITQERALQLDQEARAEIDRARRFALESPDPAPEAALEDVFA